MQEVDWGKPKSPGALAACAHATHSKARRRTRRKTFVAYMRKMPHRHIKKGLPRTKESRNKVARLARVCSFVCACFMPLQLTSLAVSQHLHMAANGQQD